MPEGNGTGRLDRIEALLDKLATSHYLHDERLSRIEALHEENEERWATWRQEMHERERRIDERIDKLVAAIGKLLPR